MYRISLHTSSHPQFVPEFSSLTPPDQGGEGTEGSYAFLQTRKAPGLFRKILQSVDSLATAVHVPTLRTHLWRPEPSALSPPSLLLAALPCLGGSNGAGLPRALRCSQPLSRGVCDRREGARELRRSRPDGRHV